MDQIKVLQEREVHSSKARDGPKHGGESAKSPGERGKGKRLHGTITINKRIKVII